MITAAHCVSGEDFDNPDRLQVVAGDYVLYQNEGDEQVIQSTSVVSFVTDIFFYSLDCCC
jgi:hypothetical protein